MHLAVDNGAGDHCRRFPVFVADQSFLSPGQAQRTDLGKDTSPVEK